MIPKGWPMDGKSLAKAAAQEAFEEAGVEGKVDDKPLGTFRHTKQHITLGMMEVSIVVHPLAVEREFADWPEHGQRQRKWFSIKQAALTVDSDELKKIILELKGTLSRARS
jgi:ADP-ribose pyrophosphatase YjhB (NUDIX family)